MRRKEDTSCENCLLITDSLRKNKTELQNKQTPAPPPRNLESFRGPWVVLLGCVYSKIISEIYDLRSTGKLGTGSSGFPDTTLSAAGGCLLCRLCRFSNTRLQADVDMGGDFQQENLALCTPFLIFKKMCLISINVAVSTIPFIQGFSLPSGLNEARRCDALVHARFLFGKMCSKVK